MGSCQGKFTRYPSARVGGADSRLGMFFEVWESLSVPYQYDAQDMGAFSSQCTHAGSMISLKSLTLTLHAHLISDSWIKQMDDLLSLSPIELFQVYSVITTNDSPLANLLVSSMLSAHGHRLTKFSVHRIRLDLNTIREVCRRCPELNQLFITLSSRDIVSVELAHWICQQTFT